ncbi:MAG: hypothetical protein US42_C0018G0007 [Candidatus Magasanikbacteria bacterium GW2011_GWC2_37_14]|uniref:Uncharacterized protein n=1 Tax=Candidatus Magasanikbacteria bacterium GW2011_GWC2_37_14 TaxID=1619046 RepID=A0A0G0G751_9BACT|nr:MAG: hypothetical protein US42_C0018G0007 [Candidatus Magasanikbacteria bacterium GW2011_GWC2_37_14]
MLRELPRQAHPGRRGGHLLPVPGRAIGQGEGQPAVAGADRPDVPPQARGNLPRVQGPRFRDRRPVGGGPPGPLPDANVVPRSCRGQQKTVH